LRLFLFEKIGRRVFTELHRPRTRACAAQNNKLMIIHIAVDLKNVFQQGKDFVWPRPGKCLQCKCDKVWGHGFRELLFDGFSQAISLKRWRCPDCRCVICYRPEGYFSRFQTPIHTIRSTLSHRLKCGRWPSGFIRFRAGHWLRSLTMRVAMYLDSTWRGRLMEAFDHLVENGMVPVSRSI
jgi:hypothetical protein